MALGVLSYQVARGHLVFMDQHVAGWVASIRSPSLDGIMHTITFFGSGSWLIVAFVGLAVFALRRGPSGSIPILVGAFLVGAAMELILRLSIPQWRPDTLTMPASMDVFTRFDLAGFPSGHGFRSAFVFGWLAKELKGSNIAKAGRIACLVMIGLVGLTRIYLNRHWATDVLGSWLIVLVALSIARVWEQRLWTRSSRHSLNAP